MITGSRPRERELLLSPDLPSRDTFSFSHHLHFSRARFSQSISHPQPPGHHHHHRDALNAMEYIYIDTSNAALSSHARTDRINCLFPWRLLIGPCSPNPCITSPRLIRLSLSLSPLLNELTRHAIGYCLKHQNSSILYK